MKKEENETFYGILMTRVLVDIDIYLFKPISIIEGCLENTKFNSVFIDRLTNTYMLSTDPESIQAENENTVGFVISEEELLKKYEELSVEEARNEYFDEITSVSHVGFYIVDKDEIVILPFKFNAILNSLNNKYELAGEMTNMSPEQIDLKDHKESYDRLMNMKKEPEKEKLNTHFFDADGLDFSSYSPDDIILMFNDYYNRIIEENDKDAIIDLIDEFIDTITSLCIYLDNNDKEDLIDIKDSLYELCDELEKVLSKNDVEKIKIECTKLKEKYKDTVTSTSELFKNEVSVTDTSKVDEKSKEIDIKAMKKFMDDTIIGQEEAKKDVIQAIYMNSLSDNPKDKNSCLLVGPTGSGKTLIAETVGKFLDKPMIIIDTTQLTMPGYVGANLEDFLQRLLDVAKGDYEKAKEGIVVFDELDKKGSENNDDVSGRGVLNTLLTFIQGTTYDVKYNNKIIHFDTSKLTIFATGALTDVAKYKSEKSYGSSSIGFNNNVDENEEDIKYEELSAEDCVKYGNIPIELIGRFPIICQLSGHTKKSLRRILLESNESALLLQKATLKKANIDLRWTDGYLDAVVEKALMLKTGARSLKAIIEKTIKEVRWEALCNKDLYSAIILTKNTVEDNKDAILVDKFGVSHNFKDIYEAKDKTELMLVKKYKRKEDNYDTKTKGNI